MAAGAEGAALLGGSQIELLGLRILCACLLCYLFAASARPPPPPPSLLPARAGGPGGPGPHPTPEGCPSCECLVGQPCECPLECPSWKEAEQQVLAVRERLAQAEAALARRQTAPTLAGKAAALAAADGMPQQAAEQCRRQQGEWQQQWLAAGGCAGDLHRKYNLTHLVQPPSQAVIGPVQDDEALLLFAAVRGMRMQTVLEVGGQGGYSARNFVKALEPTNGTMITIDIKPVELVHPTRHLFIHKDVRDVTAADLGNRRIDLLFLDCHLVDEQMHLYDALVQSKLLDEYSVIALHDTNVHPRKVAAWGYELPGGAGWVHQKAERILVERLRQLGWDAWSLHPPLRVHSPPPQGLPFRHGLTLMQRHRTLQV